GVVMGGKMPWRSMGTSSLVVGRSLFALGAGVSCDLPTHYRRCDLDLSSPSTCGLFAGRELCSGGVNVAAVLILGANKEAGEGGFALVVDQGFNLPDHADAFADSGVRDGGAVIF